MRKPAFYICENKDADQLRGDREADQRLCFRYTDSTVPLLPKYEISSLWPSSVAVQPGLCGTWSETPKTGFLTTKLIFGFEVRSLVLILPVSGNCLLRRRSFAFAIISDQLQHSKCSVRIGLPICVSVSPD